MKKLTPLMRAFYESYMKQKNTPMELIEAQCKFMSKIDERALNFINNYHEETI